MALLSLTGGLPLSLHCTALQPRLLLQDAGVALDEKTRAVKVDEYSHTNVSVMPCIAKWPNIGW